MWIFKNTVHNLGVNKICMIVFQTTPTIYLKISLRSYQANFLFLKNGNIPFFFKAKSISTTVANGGCDSDAGSLQALLRTIFLTNII